MTMFIVSGTDADGNEYYWNGVGWGDSRKEAALLHEQWACAALKQRHREFVMTGAEQVRVKCDDHDD